MLMATAQQELPLYGTGAIPNSKPGPDQEVRTPGSRGSWDYGLSKTSRPTLTVFLPGKGKATGMGIVVCPGGGYSHSPWDMKVWR
ncbi:hypothetical protein ACQ86N_38310 [Puia sp. P3]|uniref:hypothetical protein n=1 Tax=Puia sp. P3 TaxID=3423952 RepID=UPI003D6737FF